MFRGYLFNAQAERATVYSRTEVLRGNRSIFKVSIFQGGFRGFDIGFELNQSFSGK